MSDLQARFNKAVELVQKQPADGPFQTTVQDKLVFYSLFKQATEGPCSTKKPSMLNPVAKAKWDAWSKLGNMSKEQAMQKYIDTLVELVNKTPASPFKEEVMKTVVPRKAATAQASGSQGTKGKVLIYGDLMSQPTRAVLWFCLLNNINHEFKAIRLAKGEHLKPEYVKLNPHKKVPCIDDSGFIVYESHAIMRYLATRYRTTEQWFPHNLSSRTRIDQYLDWHHLNLRRGASTTVFAAVFAGPTGRQIPEAIVEEGKTLLVNSLQAIETVWLKNSDFLAGSSRPSIADLSAYEEIASLTQFIQYDLSPYPKVQKWAKAMEALPHYAKAHEALAKVAQALQAKKKEEQPAGEQTPQAKL